MLASIIVGRRSMKNRDNDWQRNSLRYSLTALFACECQSFRDNLIADLGEIGAWNDPRGCWFRGRSLA